MTTFILLIALLSAPLLVLFLPIIKEVFNRRSKNGIALKDTLSDDPRALAKNIRHSIKTSLQAKASRGVFEGQVRLPLYLEGILKAKKNTVFFSEVYATDGAEIAESSKITSLVSDGPVTLGPLSIVEQCIDAESSMRIGAGSLIKGTACCSAALEIGKESSFNSLYGMPVQSYHSETLSELHRERISDTASISQTAIYISAQISTLPPETVIEQDMVVKGPLIIGKGAILKMNLKCYGSLTMMDDVTVMGNIFCESSITIGPRCKVFGSVFSQENVIVHAGAQIGTKEAFKSLIGAAGVTLENNIAVYGYIYAGGKGKIV